MALSDIEEKLTAGVPAGKCAVCHWMDERGPEWSERLRRMLRNRGIKFSAIATELDDDADEPAISWEALSRHARAECAAKERLRQ